MPQVAARPRDNAPDLSTLQQLAGNGGPLSLEISRASGNMLEHIWQQGGLDPQQIHAIYPTLQGYAGGGDYIFKVTTPNNPSLRPVEWTRRLPGVPRKPVDVAVAEAQTTAAVMGSGGASPPIMASMQGAAPLPGMPQWPTQPPPQPQQFGWGAPQVPPMPPMYPPPMWGAPSMMGFGGMGGGMGGDFYRQQMEDLRRQQLEEKHRSELDRFEMRAREEQKELLRKLEEMDKRHQAEKQESAQVLALRELGEKLRTAAPESQQTNLLAALFSTIAESNKSNVEQIRLAAQAAIEAGRSDKQQPYVDTMIKHLLEQSSPRAVAEMAATSGEIMTSAMSMMAQAVASAGGGDASDAKMRMLMEAFGKVGQVAAGLMAGQQQGGAEAKQQVVQAAVVKPAEAQPAEAPAPQSTDAQKQAAIEVTPTPETDETAKRSEAGSAELMSEDLKKIVANLRQSVVAGSITPEAAATASADILYRYYLLLEDSRLIVAFVKDAEGTTAKLFPDWTPDQRKSFVAALLPAAQKVGFKVEDLTKLGVAA